MSHDELITFTYNGHSFTYDIGDADDAERYEAAIKKMGDTEKSLPKDGSISVIYRAQCKYLKTFFDDVLGAGAGQKVCGEKDNVTICYTAYMDFLRFIAAQRDNILDTRNALHDLAPRKTAQPQIVQRNNPPAPKPHQQKNRHH